MENMFFFLVFTSVFSNVAMETLDLKQERNQRTKHNFFDFVAC